MFATIIKEPFLVERLDAEQFSPEKFKLELTVINSSLGNCSLGSLVVPGTSITYGVVQPGEFVEPHAGVRMIRCVDIKDLSVAADSVFWISNRIAAPYQRSTVEPRDILIGIAGTLGNIGIAPDGISPANVNQSVARTRIHDISGADPEWVACFLASRFGQAILLRRSVGSVQQHLNLSDLPSVPVIFPSIDVRRYVGRKVQLADRLRSFAHQRELQFSNALLNRLPELNSKVPNNIRHSRTRAANLDGSLNPGAFNPDRLHIRSYLKANGGVPVSALASVTTPVTSVYRNSDWYIGLDAIGSGLGRISPSTIEAEGVTGSVRILSEGPVISKLRPYLNKVAYIPTHLASSFGSTELLCVRSNEPSIDWYLCGVLQLMSTVRQLNPVSTGSTHPRVSREDILNCYVPWIGDAANVGLLLADAQKAYFLSDKLIVAAKLLVESLVDGTIVERNLADAQTRVEQGDQNGDREILGRLCEGGIDATDTRLLFPDLDAYYETLLMAEQALADGGDE